MAPRVYYKTAAGATVEITDYLDRRLPWSLTEKAEEGAVGDSTIVVNDRAMALDFDGHRQLWVVEDDSEATDNVLFGGYVGKQTISRGEGDTLEPLGRSWTLQVVDGNSIWNRRVMTGADCKRPAEDDTDRVGWVLSSSESGIFDDITTYVSAANNVAMDKGDLRRQYRDQIMGDCAEHAQKNWWAQLQETGTGREWVAWYGKESVTTYESPLLLSNDPANLVEADMLDGTSLVWPISDDTKMDRDPARVYSGVLVEWDGGWVYRKSATTAATYASRDYIAPARNIKTKAKAISRAERLLAKLDTMDKRITTTVVLPKGKASKIRAGMRVPFRATHLPGFQTAYQWCRVVACTVTPWEAGARYSLALELVPTGQEVAVERGTAGGILYGPDDSLSVGVRSDWDVDWRSSGDAPGPGELSQPLDTSAFAYHSTGGYEDGFEVVCDSGTLDLRTVFDFIYPHTGHPDITFTASIQKNGADVATATAFFAATGSFGNEFGVFDFTATDVAVVTGDVLTVHLVSTVAVGITIPSGTGESQYFRILSTSVVAG